MAKVDLRNWLARWRAQPDSTRLGNHAWTLSIAFLAFVYGFGSAYFGFFPSRVFENAIVSATVITDLNRKWGNPFPGFRYYDIGQRKHYKNIADKDEPQNRLTVLNYFNGGDVYIVNKAGDLLHRYNLNLTKPEIGYYFDQFDNKVAHLDKARSLYIQDIHIYPNGDALMMINVGGGVWPFGVGFVKVDRESRILWKSMEFNTHHEMEVAEDGRIFALAHGETIDSRDGLDSIPGPILEDYVVILGPDGKVIDRINLLLAIKNSRYSFYLTQIAMLPLTNKGPKGDYVHANDVDVITADQARVFPFGNKGDLLVSMRNIHAIGVLDIKERKFKWMKRGPWIAQHDPDILPNGHLMIFDNLGAEGEGGLSRIIEFDPKTDRVVWSYQGTADEPFESRVRGSQQPLPNGNVLISETMGSRVFEVTRAGRIVWQFVSPFRFGKHDQYVPAVRWPRRLPPDYFTPEFRARLEKAGKRHVKLDGVLPDTELGDRVAGGI